MTNPIDHHQMSLQIILLPSKNPCQAARRLKLFLPLCHRSPVNDGQKVSPSVEEERNSRSGTLSATHLARVMHPIAIRCFRSRISRISRLTIPSPFSLFPFVSFVLIYSVLLLNFLIRNHHSKTLDLPLSTACYRLFPRGMESLLFHSS